MESKSISFDEISSIWQTELWPKRVSPIETHSAMTWPFDGNPIQYDMDIFNYEPTFFGVFNDGSLVGVNSGHRTKDTMYRSRGIWVNSNFRKTGVAQILFNMTESQAVAEGCNLIWSIPRKSAVKSYTLFGFKTVGNYFDKGMEFGPNIYVKKDLDVNS